MKNKFKKLTTKIILPLLLIIGINSSAAQSFADVPEPINPGSVCTNLTFNLKLRSKDINTNGEVSDLQSFLQDKGYLDVDPTGFFGRMTEKAVKNYQSAKNIVSNGYVDRVTRSAISFDTCGSNTLPLPIPVVKDYVISMSIYSSGLSKYLTKNTSGYFDATDVDGNVNFKVDTSNSATCIVKAKTNSGYYSDIAFSKSFSQNYNKNGLGFDYYKVSCGDGTEYKKIEQDFMVETKAPTQIKFRPVADCVITNGYIYDSNCNCPSVTVGDTKTPAYDVKSNSYLCYTPYYSQPYSPYPASAN